MKAVSGALPDVLMLYIDTKALKFSEFDVFLLR